MEVQGYKPSVERRAGRIADPVEKLRFLRREMADFSLEPRPRKPNRIIPLVRHGGWVVVFVLLVLTTGPMPKGVAETVARERGLLVPRANPASAVVGAVPKVWRVDRSDTSEL